MRKPGPASESHSTRTLLLGLLLVVSLGAVLPFQAVRVGFTAAVASP